MKKISIYAAALLIGISGLLTYSYDDYYYNGGERVLGTTATGALIGGIAGGPKGAGYGALGGALYGIATQPRRPARRSRGRKSRKKELRKLKKERRSLELKLTEAEEELSAIEGGHTQANRREINRLEKKITQLEDQLQEVENAIDDLQ
ncbi:MAG TPA: hypothetical protein VGW78_06755 [Candidatus Babeliales bacterium]|nr:hypothetical protein [Candidatus Babeliales bacterium]